MTAIRPLLTTSTADDEDEDNLDDEKLLINDERYLRNRHKIHRRIRKFFRIFIFSFCILGLLLIIYIPIFNSVHSRTMPLPGWGYNISRNISDYIFPNIETTIIEPRNTCLHNFFLLIVVCSSVNNFAARQMIRETWGNVSEFNYPMFNKIHSHMSGQYLNIRQHNVRLHAQYLNLPNITENLNIFSQLINIPIRVVFLIGKNDAESDPGNETIARLKLESEQYDDLVQEDFIDTYNNLTIKSVMMLKWIQTKCLNRMKFIMKCDDDTFVNIPNLLQYLLGGTIPIYNDTVEFYDPRTINALSPSNRMLITQNLLTGYLFCYVAPVSDVKSKWYAPYYMYSGDIYPNYISGSSYLMSYDVIGKLYNSSLNTSILHLEDVYLTGMCSKKIGLHRRHNSLFVFNNSKTLCSYKGTITQHYIKGDLMRNIYNFVMNTTIHCPPPDKYFKMRRLKQRPKNCS